MLKLKSQNLWEINDVEFKGMLENKVWLFQILTLAFLCSSEKFLEVTDNNFTGIIPNTKISGPQVHVAFSCSLLKHSTIDLKELKAFVPFRFDREPVSFWG